MLLKIRKSRHIYEIEFNRKITVLRGDSGIGKSSIAKLLKQSKINRNISVFTDNNYDVIVLDYSSNWGSDIMLGTKNTLFVLDEDCIYINEHKFAKIVHESESRFIFITRSPLKSLNYSYQDIISLKTHGNLTKSYNIYKESDFSVLSRDCVDIITEDSKSGYEFLKYHLGRYKPYNVLSCEGKSKVSTAIESYKDRYNIEVGIIADGAAIGCEMSDIISTVELCDNINVQFFFPECFEELLIRASILNFDKKKISYRLDSINNYSSYETFYYNLLIELVQFTPASYNKSTINECYLRDCCFRKQSKCVLYKAGEKTDKVIELIFGGSRNENMNVKRGGKNDKLLFQ